MRNTTRHLASAFGGGSLSEFDSLTVHVPIRTVSEMNQRENPFARHRRHKAHYAAVIMCWGTVGRFWVRANEPPYAVTLTRVAPRKLDADNLAASFKAVQDEVARQLGVNDGGPQVTWDYQQRPGGKGEYAVDVTVTRAA